MHLHGATFLLLFSIDQRHQQAERVVITFQLVKLEVASPRAQEMLANP
jgi:hypothetical protein